jgi:uncharacterized membrane protein YfcA
MVEGFGFTAYQVAVSACIVFGAFVVRGVSGFGAGMFGIPLLAFVMPVHTAISMFGLLVLCLFAFLSVRDWGEVDRDELRRLLAPTLAGVAAGILLFAYLDNRLLLQLLGGFLVAYALYMMAVHAFGLPQFSCSPRWAAPVAFVGGVFDTLFGGGGGTLVVIYLHMRGLGRAGFRATVAVLWLAEMIARIIGYGATGQYSTDVLLLFALLLPLMAAGTWVGERLDKRISQEAFSKLMALLLLLTGAGLLGK